jgi:uncharacterized protein (DUF1330 family)
MPLPSDLAASLSPKLVQVAAGQPPPMRGNYAGTAAGDSANLAAFPTFVAVAMEEELQMTAYWLARASVDDAEQYALYARRVPGILQQYGGEVLARGGRHEMLEGPEAFSRFVVVAFPSLDAARACFRSSEYQEAAQFRRDGGGVVEITIVEGV